MIMEYQSPIVEKTSKFSSGINIIMRLDGLWRDTHSHSRAGRYQAWNTDMDRIWLELARDLDGNDFKEKKKEFEKFEKELTEIGMIEDTTPSGFGESKVNDKSNRNSHYKKLMEKQLFIARLENKLGKGTTFDEGDEDDFE